jgi:hypothetical protein
MAQLEVGGEVREIPKIWSMPLAEGRLVFDLHKVDTPSDEDYPGFYSVYRFEPDRRADASLWSAIEEMDPVGRIPATDVEPVDDPAHAFRLGTMGIERFAMADA